MSRIKGALIYHDMRVHEDFQRCVERLYCIVRDAVRKWPQSERTLCFDVQGHRNSAGGYDDDAFEVIRYFIPNVLAPYLNEFRTPFGAYRNPKKPRSDIPDAITIVDYDADSRPDPRTENHEARRSKPSLRVIADYLGLGQDPECMICWAKPVERAHVVPVALGGSNDVRNFALLCKKHHELAPDVEDATAFWQWMDWRLDLDHPTVRARRREDVSLDQSAKFFSAVREELRKLYSETIPEMDSDQFVQLLNEYHHILQTRATKHFGIEKKTSTHAWALHRALHIILEVK